MNKKTTGKSSKKKTNKKNASNRKISKNKQKQGPQFSIKEFVMISLIFLVIAASFWAFNVVREYFLTSSMFTVKKISTNVSINYKLRPGNIFKIDLKKVENDISAKHPEFKSVRVNRAFPDVLDVQVVERIPFFQVEKNAYYLLDQESVVIAGPSDVPYDDILVYPSFAKRSHFRLGKKVDFEFFDQVIELISYLKRYNASKVYTIGELRVPSLNQMNFLLDTIEVRIGEGDYAHKIDILFERILPQYNHDFEKIEYIDLRFNDYVIGYKK